MSSTIAHQEDQKSQPMPKAYMTMASDQPEGQTIVASPIHHSLNVKNRTLLRNSNKEPFENIKFKRSNYP